MRHSCHHGWTCEQHPDQPWAHDDCSGSGAPCPYPGCSFVTDGQPRIPPQFLPLARVVRANEKTIKTALWAIVSIVWTTAIVGAVVLWRSL